MCNKCVKQEFPQRESLCAEDGIYLINFKGCSECGSLNRAMDSLKQVGKKVTEELDEDITKEIVRFDHSCAQCGHVCATHLHEFWIESGYQEYRMECSLCGQGENSIFVLPKDPKKISASF